MTDHPPEPPQFAALRAGCPIAFAALYVERHGFVFGYALAGVFDRHLAEDLASETFARAWRRIGTLAWQGRDPAAWLITITKNLITDHYKSSRARFELLVDQHYDKELAADDAGFRQVESADLVAAVLAALAGLTEGQRTVIRLRYLQELNVEETAGALGVSTGAAKTLQGRAMSNLRKTIAAAA